MWCTKQKCESREHVQNSLTSEMRRSGAIKHQRHMPACMCLCEHAVFACVCGCARSYTINRWAASKSVVHVTQSITQLFKGDPSVVSHGENFKTLHISEPSGLFEWEVRGVISQIKRVSRLIQALKTMISPWICGELKAACLALDISCALTKESRVREGDVQCHANGSLMHCNIEF